MARGKYRFLGVLVPLLLVVGLGTIGHAATQAAAAPDCSSVEYNGTGTEENPYEVANADQLQCIKEQGLGAAYEVVSEVNASETETWNDGDGFEPIGAFDTDGDTEFTGSFDGGGHTIEGLYIDRPRRSDTGLFGVIKDAKIEDTALEGVNLTGSQNVGGLAGGNLGGDIETSYVEGTVEGDEFVGGLVGVNTGSVRESYAAADVEGQFRSGGFVGVNTGDIRKSYATGDIEGDNFLGGLVGVNIFGGSVNESYAGGFVGGGGERVGGLVGFNRYSETEDSYWDIPATGRGDSDGGTGLGVNDGTPIANEMTGEDGPESMEGFDFEDSWSTAEPDRYPVLSWQVNGDTQSDGHSEREDGEGNGTNGDDISETEDTEETAEPSERGSDDGEENQGERLPGFTTVTTVLALLTVVAAAVRRRTE